MSQKKLQILINQGEAAPSSVESAEVMHGLKAVITAEGSEDHGPSVDFILESPKGDIFVFPVSHTIIDEIAEKLEAML